MKTFFKGVKEATQSGVVARTFVTGVNPLLLDDLTSGFNIAANLSLEPDFSGMLGFATAEVQDLVTQAANRDLIHFNEAGVKAIALAFCTLSDEIALFSEWETGGGYADLVIVPQPTAHWLTRAWMIELKYLRKKDDTLAERQRLLTEGQTELRGYQADERRMRYLSRYDLRSAVALFVDADELVWQDGPQVSAAGSRTPPCA